MKSEMQCQVADLNGERIALLCYIAVGAYFAFKARKAEDGRAALRNAWPLCALALLIAAHRFAAGFPGIHWLRGRERSLGNGDTPVLIEHFVTGVLCAWAASIIVRGFSWMLSKVRDLYQDQRLPAVPFWITAVGMPVLVVALCYDCMGAWPVWIIPALVISPACISFAMAPARITEWASENHWAMCIAIALVLWAFISLSFGYCQLHTGIALVAHNAEQQLFASFGGLVLQLAVRVLWRPLCATVRILVTSIRTTTS